MLTWYLVDNVYLCNHQPDPTRATCDQSDPILDTKQLRNRKR